MLKNIQHPFDGKGAKQGWTPGQIWTKPCSRSHTFESEISMTAVSSKMRSPKLLVAFAVGCLLSNSATAGLSTGEGGSKCRLLSDYQTSVQPFKSLSPDAALAQILKSTPFFFERQDWMTKAGKVTSEGDGGSLDKVLAGFGEAVNVSIKQDGCKIVVAANKPREQEEKKKAEKDEVASTKESSLLPDVKEAKKEDTSTMEKPDLVGAIKEKSPHQDPAKEPAKETAGVPIPAGEIPSANPFINAEEAKKKPDILPPAVNNEWKFTSETRLRKIMEDWASRAGWTLVWKSSYEDFNLLAGASFQGEFVEVIKKLVEALPESVVIRITLYEGNRVVYVQDKDS